MTRETRETREYFPPRIFCFGSFRDTGALEDARPRRHPAIEREVELPTIAEPEAAIPDSTRPPRYGRRTADLHARFDDAVDVSNDTLSVEHDVLSVDDDVLSLD